MVLWSQLDRSLEIAACHHVVHPWTKSCLLNFVDAFFRTAAGASLFYGVHYPYNYFLNYAKHCGNPSEETKVSATDYAKMFLKSTLLFGALEGSLALVISCMLRNMIGRFTKLSVILIPGTLSGLTILFQDEKSRLLYSTYWINFVMSFTWTMLKQSGTFKMTLLQKTTIFMACSSILSGLLKYVGSDAPKYRFYWFFHPYCHKSKSDDSKCYHNHSCLRHIVSNTKNYLITGILLSALKISFKNGNKPRELLNALLNKESYLPALFFGLYALIFHGTRCGLCKMAGESTIGHNLFAGALAGLAFIFQPSTTLFNTAPITLVQILSRMAIEKKYIPNLSYVEIAYTIANGILFDAAVLYPSQCPRIASYIINTSTMGRANDIAHWTKLRETFNNWSVPSGKIFK